jgi:hypothetical protein
MATYAAKPFATNVRQVNYGGKFLYIFPGAEFPILCRLVVLRHDIIRMPAGEPADRSKPLQDWFGFVRDQR